MTQPVRLQRTRSSGSRVVSPNGLEVVYCGRGSKWGNPYRIERDSNRWTVWLVGAFLNQQPLEVSTFSDYGSAVECALDLYGDDLANGKLGFTESDVRRELAGKNLLCWCPLVKPRWAKGDVWCHASALLRIAAS